MDVRSSHHGALTPGPFLCKRQVIFRSRSRAGSERADVLQVSSPRSPSGSAPGGVSELRPHLHCSSRKSQGAIIFMEITRGVHLLQSTSGSYVYLILREEPILIDTSLPGRAAAILTELETLGL